MVDYKGMDVHEALEEVTSQKEKLEEEVRIKTDLCNNMKKSQDELITKLQEAKLQSEKQAQELSAKSEELSTLSQLHQDLKSSFQEKESAFKQLNSAIEKLRYEYGEKVQKSENKNKELVLALEEAKTVSESLKSKVDSSNVEIEDLKRVVSLKDKKIVEISDKTKTARDLIQRDEVICKLEEQHRDVQDQLKWRNEQFQHLEEAHKKLHDNFEFSRTEWEKEKSLLLDEICSLQTNLDSQTRISENLQTQLSICNQALAHEQSSKKLLQVEIAEYKARYEDVFSECHEAKLTIEKLSHKRDEEVAELRDNLAAKDSLSKEMGYKMGHLEQENKDLIISLKEFQESQISNGGNTGVLRKLQKKYSSLEQAHKKCSEKLKVEVELKYELERLRKEIDDYSTKLKDQSEQVIKLQEELKSRHSLPEVQNEEISSSVSVLKTQLSEMYTKMEQKNKENEDMIVLLKEELEVKNNVICEIDLNLTKKCEEVASLMKKVELYDDMKRQLLAESSRTQVLLEEKNRVLEDARNSSEVLSQKSDELEKEKVFVENRKMQLETENQSLRYRVNEQNEKIVDLQQQLVSLKTCLTERTEAQKKETEKNLEITEEKESSIKMFLSDIEEKKQRIEVLGKEMKKYLKISVEKQKLENEVSCLCEEVKVKDQSLLKSTQRAEELEDLLRVIKLETENMRDENRCLVNNLEAQNRKIEELVNEKTNVSKEKQKLENEVSCLCEEVKGKDESLLKLTQRAEELEYLFRVSKLETENMMDENKRLVNTLEAQKQKIKELEKEMTNAFTISVEKQKLENEVSCLYEEVTVKDESLLKSTQQAEKLEDLLRATKLEAENLRDENTCLVNNLEAQNMRMEELDKEKKKALTSSEEKQIEFNVIRQDFHKMEDEISCLYEKFKLKDESLLKLTQRAEELEDLLRVNTLETTNVMDENMRLVHDLETQNRRIEELEKEMTNAVTISKEKQIENDVIHQNLHKLEDEISSLCEKIKVKDESFLKSTQQREELEELLRINKAKTKNLKDENTRLVNQVSNLEAQNQALCEDIEKIVLHRDDLLKQMETESKQMGECFKDDELTRMLENMLHRC